MKSRSVFSGIQMNWFVVLAGVFCLTMATGASAEEPSNPCAEDVAKLCKGVEPGAGRIAECIKKHTSELSPTCKNGLAEAENISKKERNPEFIEACKDDMKALCKGIPAGSGKILQCLKKHLDDVDSECKEMLK